MQEAEFHEVADEFSAAYLGRTNGATLVVWGWTDGANLYPHIEQVEAPAGRLAVLSGCETGRSRPNLGSEEVSLPAAFLAAGYAAVVGSRWAVGRCTLLRPRTGPGSLNSTIATGR